jgi:antitoxin VapB
MQTATVITHGSSQSVQLPEGFHIAGAEVYVKHLGTSVLLIPKDANTWDLLAASLDQFTDDFMADRSQPPQQPREAPFE